jgi:hypothetical protein
VPQGRYIKGVYFKVVYFSTELISIYSAQLDGRLVLAPHIWCGGVTRAVSIAYSSSLWYWASFCKAGGFGIPTFIHEKTKSPEKLNTK